MTRPEHRVWIKICGVVTLEDAMAAAAFGADAVGFVFADSKRKIDPASAKAIVRALPPGVMAVGVFEDDNIGRVQRIADETRLDAVQLHGSESPEYCMGMRHQVIKRFALQAGETSSSLASRMRAYPVFGYLLDPGRGEGKLFDWGRAAGTGLPLIIAGGLNLDNVVDAVRLLRPYGIDVSSGVEESPGRKDKAKMKRFIEEVRHAEQPAR